jgi:hypothetical protein
VEDIPLTNLIPHIFPDTANISSLPSPEEAADAEDSPISDLARNFNLDLVTLYTEFGLVDGLTRAPIPSRGRVDNSSGRLYAFVRIADDILDVLMVELILISWMVDGVSEIFGNSAFGRQWIMDRCHNEKHSTT